MNNHKFLGSIGLLCLLSLSACAPKTGTLYGKVVFQDKSFTEGDVLFLDKNGIGHAPAKIDPNGNYEAKGLPYGEIKIAVVHRPTGQKTLTQLRKEWKAKGGEPPEEEIDKTRTQSLLPAKYGDHATSELSVFLSNAKTEYDIHMVADP